MKNGKVSFMVQNNEETVLIRGIVANPDDDTPRLEYATWLEQHGRASRARLIRIQCQLERLHTEEKGLIEQHGREWAGPLFAAGADDWQFHRGFPEEVTMRFDDYLSEHARLNEITPLCRLHLIGGTDDNLRRLANLSAANQIRSLEIDRPSDRPEVVSFGIEGIRALAASPKLGQLRRLSLHSHHIGADGAEVVAGAPTFNQLTHLALTDPALQDAGNEPILRLINSPNLLNLIDLQVGNSKFGQHVIQSMRSGEQSRAEGRGPAS
jgi:uncharacterized protein (TIGR02996 family)